MGPALIKTFNVQTTFCTVSTFFSLTAPLWLLLYSFISDLTMLYPSSRSSACIFFFSFIFVNCKLKYNKQKKDDPCKTWVKISKVMPQPNSPFPWEREGSLTAKSPNFLAKIQYGLTVHICFFVFKFTSKIFQT